MKRSLPFWQFAGFVFTGVFGTLLHFLYDWTDSKFSALFSAVNEEKMAAFWQWFAGYEEQMKNLLDHEKYDEGLTPIARQLLEAFPFLEEIPNVGLGKNEKGYVVELKDYYAVAIVAAYEKLLSCCPEEINARWQFVIAH